MTLRLFVLLLTLQGSQLFAGDISGSAPGQTWEGSDNFLSVTYLPEAFANKYGQFENDHYVVYPTAGGRLGTIAKTPGDIILAGPGKIAATVTFNGSFSGFVKDIRDVNNLYVTKLLVRYKDSSGREHFSEKMIKVTELGSFKKIASDPVEGDYYYAGTVDQYLDKTVNVDIEVPDDDYITDISAELVAIFPDTSVKIRTMSVKVWGTYEF
tara:strand:+ start:761 stop:1393 length:633 start_codon:yes stop_codon:yes gene_type:complete